MTVTINGSGTITGATTMASTIGTLTATNLSDGTNTTSTTNPVKGSAKAWVNFNGQGGASIRGSFNVSSVTYNTTGVYTLNFTTSLATANYGMAGMVATNTSSGAGWSVSVYDNGSYTPTDYSLQVAVGVQNGWPSEYCARTIGVAVFA